MEARNGREALSLLTQHSDQIALVLSDAVMPEMGGVALFHAMQERGFMRPFVIITGHAIEKDMQNLRTMGLFGWLKKPLDISKLAELLDEGLRGCER
jgi:DNA-binding NtrC family response regulator